MASKLESAPMTSPARRRPTSPPGFDVSVEHGTGYEALLGLSMFTGDEPQDSYEVGKAWFTRVRALASTGLTTAVRQLVGGEGGQWFQLLGLAHDAGRQHSVEDLLAELGKLRAEELQVSFIGGRLSRFRSGEGLALVRRVQQGDRKAAIQLAARSGAGSARTAKRIAAIGAAGVKRLTIEIVERWRREILSQLGDFADALAADANDKRKLARRLPGPRLIEVATGGVVYEGEAGIDRVLLVPSVVTRPWATISEWDNLKIICYPASPSSRPAENQTDRTLAAIYRALGDETRLRLLRELSAGDRRLTELAEALGLAKSTVHGHLGALRSAGLIRVSLGREKRYGLRPGLLDLNRLLKDYLSGP